MIIASVGGTAAGVSSNIASLLYAVAALATNSIDINNLPSSTSIMQPATTTTTTTTTTTLASTTVAATTQPESLTSAMQTKNYEFENGTVQLQDPWTVRLRKSSSSSSPSPSTTTLRNPILLGSGGGGAVFSYQLQQQNDSKNTAAIDDKNEVVAVKISWSRSAASVENECYVLETLQDRLVSYPSTRSSSSSASSNGNDAGNNDGDIDHAVVSSSGIERCLGRVKYGPDPNRSVIFLQPVLPSTSVSSVSDLSTIDKQKVATRTLIRTTVQMLASGIVTSDVQPLMDPDTGRTVLIDLTEAKVLGSSSSSTTDSPRSISTTSRQLDQQDIALVNSFCTEIAILIPESLYGLASTEFVAEMTRIEQGSNLSLFTTDQNPKGNNDNGRFIVTSLFVDPNVQQILKSLPFANDDMVQFLEEQSIGQ